MAHHTTHDAAGHDGHGHGAHAHGAHGHEGHDAEVAADKRAAFLGLFGGMVVLGAFLFGMVTWTNHHLAGGEAHSAAEATK